MIAVKDTKTDPIRLEAAHAYLNIQSDNSKLSRDSQCLLTYVYIEHPKLEMKNNLMDYDS